MLTQGLAAKLQALEVGANQARAALEKDNEVLRGTSQLTDNTVDPILTNKILSQAR